jgi:hypothetical protein
MPRLCGKKVKGIVVCIVNRHREVNQPGAEDFLRGWCLLE